MRIWKEKNEGVLPEDFLAEGAVLYRQKHTASIFSDNVIGGNKEWKTYSFMTIDKNPPTPNNILGVTLEGIWRFCVISLARIS